MTTTVRRRAIGAQPKDRLVNFDNANVTPLKVATALMTDGCCVVRNLVSRRVMAKVRAEMQPWLERTPTGDGDFIAPASARSQSRT